MMRDIDGRNTQLALNGADLLAQRQPGFRVERRDRFVEQQHLGLNREYTSQSDALLLAT